MKKPKTKSLEELMAEHTALYKEFLPTLDKYSDMAKRALELQIEIFKLRLTQAQPAAEFLSLAPIATISARETPAKLGQLLDALAKKEVAVKTIIYDPINFAFHLYGNP